MLKIKQVIIDNCLLLWYYIKKKNWKIVEKEGKQHIDEFEGFESTVLCHEIDHLDGILHIDIADIIIKGTKEERIELRKKDGYTVISKNGEYRKGES